MEPLSEHPVVGIFWANVEPQELDMAAKRQRLKDADNSEDNKKTYKDMDDQEITDMYPFVFKYVAKKKKIPAELTQKILAIQNKYQIILT